MAVRFKGWIVAAVGMGILQASAQTAVPLPAAVGGNGQSLPPPTAYQITKFGGNQRVWERTVYERSPSGTMVGKKHRYTELATGMYYQNHGQWVEAKEEIEPAPAGAVARQGQHQVIFASNLNAAGAIDQQTADGKRLRSNILGLAYYDSASGQSVLIAQIQDALGELISSNQVLYPNAFSGVKADVRYTYKKASFEQDVILREQPPTPESLGLNSQTTEIEVLTEFINPPAATVSENHSKNSVLPDDDIAWGATRISHGKAFDLGESANKARQVRVRRQYETVEGRKILVEGVPVQEIQPDLSRLPLQSSVRLKNLPVFAVKTWMLPKTPVGRSTLKPMSLAAASISSPGYVLDYVEINTEQDDFTFQGDTTYYVSGFVYCGGDAVLEGGAVLKYPEDDSGCVDGVMTCESGPYRPAVLTSMDDDSVGEAISGSSGSPSTNGCTYLLFESFTLQSGLALNNVRISYAGTGAADDNEADWVGVSDSQFINCTEALSTEADTIGLNNDLLSNCGTVVSIFNAGEIDLTQVTADQIGLFINDPKGNGSCGMALTNSILSDVSDMMAYDDNLTFTDTADVSLVNSVLTGTVGNVEVVSTQSSYQPADASGLYQSVGGGDYYLASGSPYHGAGMNDLDAGVLADIAAKTTYPPTVYSGMAISVPTTFSPQAPRDNTGNPDLGYHYDPLDYVFGGVDEYSNLTFTAGTTVGWYNDDGGYGVSLNGSSEASFNGTATAPCVLASANMVQEGGNGVWTAETDWGGFIGLGGNDTEDTAPALNLDFTRCYARSSEGNYFTDSGDGTALAVNAGNSEFYGGAGFGGFLFLDLANCLAVRATLGADSAGPAAVTLETCTLYGGSLTAGRESLDGGSGDISQWPVFVENCAFAGTDIEPLINRSGGGTNVTWFDYNCFLTTDTPPNYEGSDSATVTAYNWEASWFGAYYLPANSPLRRAGSTTSDQLGLYHFTTQTNQVPETNAVVDIGYHYVATDTNGNPFSTSGNGIPDYIADSNGDGLYDAGDFSDWLDYYNGVLPYLETYDGDQQAGPLGEFLPQPLIESVMDANDFPLTNAPITFSVTNALPELSATYGGVCSSNVQVRTDRYGLATVWLYLPASAPGTNYVFATARSETDSTCLENTFYEANVSAPAINPNGGTATMIRNVTLSSAAGAVIHYTLDGSVPAESDPAVANGGTVPVPWNCTLSAKAYDDSILLPSTVASATFGLIHPLAAGQMHTLLLEPTETILAAGSNGRGQLGDGSTIDSTNLADVSDLDDAAGIAAGALHSLAWDTNGIAWAWGDDTHGQLGDGAPTAYQTAPVQVANLTAVSQMAGGYEHSLALETNTLVWAWGDNSSGQLGDGTTAAETEPEQVAGLTNIVELAAGGWHSLVLSNSGAVFAWGGNTYGQLGDGTTTERNQPVPVTSLTHVFAIAAGFGHSVAIMSDETVRAWGENNDGQVGDGTTTAYRTAPVVVGVVSNVVAVACGEDHTLALEANGTVWAWGLNSHGQLGDGTTTTRTAPVMVSGLTNVLAIAAGGAHSAALRADGSVWIWGGAGYGLNGDASTACNTTPVNFEPAVSAEWDPPLILSQPFSQSVQVYDPVTFGVTAVGTNLTYQWSFNGVPIPGATTNTYAILNTRTTDSGSYAVTVGTGLNSVTSSNAVLTVLTGDIAFSLVTMYGPRMDFTFRTGITYFFPGSVELYGTTTIEPGAVFKFDVDDFTNSSVVVMGTLNCEATPYNPAVFTSQDDDTIGITVANSYDYPETMPGEAPFLDLRGAPGITISNLVFRYADIGVSTPAAGLDAWDCRFVYCNAGIYNDTPAPSTNGLHNVLFAQCGAALKAATNAMTVQGEQVSADVVQFCEGPGTATRVALTNSLVAGSTIAATTVADLDVALNPDPTNFVSAGDGGYYLAANSPFRKAGTAGISPALQTDLQHKTTCAPLAIYDDFQLSGQMTLGPQAERYTNGAPDLGYYYQALDYTVADFNVAGGQLTVLPGTVVGARNDLLADGFDCTYTGFDINQGGTVVSHGTPTKPIVYVWADLVQEIPNQYLAEFQDLAGLYGVFQPGMITFNPGCQFGDATAPSLNFRFTQFYLPFSSEHVGAGQNEDGSMVYSECSAVNLTLQDCQLSGGYLDLGLPITYSNYCGGAVFWQNNLFDAVNINLDPCADASSEYRYGVPDVNVDLSFHATGNLFREDTWLHLEPFPASAGNWSFTNNLLDLSFVFQDFTQPLNYDYNGYWTYLPSPDYAEIGTFQPPDTEDPIDGAHDQTLTTAPPYQPGPFGNYYLPNTTPLYGAGSDTPANLGLYHYTTRPDQVKEGAEPSGHKANIGLHYIAAASGAPMDSDGDGIPDYVEDANGNGSADANETEWTTQYTVAGIWDPTNSIYGNIDLSGDGLVGNVKTPMGIQPFDAGNPLTLIEVTNIDPEIATFEIPLSYTVLTNIGDIHLWVDNVAVPWQECCQATDGNCLLKWNTTFNSPGLHYLHASVTINGVGGADDNTVTILNGDSALVSYNSENILQFNPLYSFIRNGSAELVAYLTQSQADYTIDFQTVGGSHLRTMTGYTSSGEIDTNWNLLDDDGNAVTNETVKAVVSVTLLSPDPPPINYTLLFNTFTPPPVDSSLTVSCTSDIGGSFRTALTTCIEQGVVDPLTSLPESGGSGGDNYYPDDFNAYTWSGDQNGDPGFISTNAPAFENGTPDHSKTDLLNSLTNTDNCNFYFYGHGSQTAIGNNTPYYLKASTIADKLQNFTYSTTSGWQLKHPYRFVFIDACETRETMNMANAFGIEFATTPWDLAKNPALAQAYFGWNGDDRIPVADQMPDLQTTDYILFQNWQLGIPLRDCLDAAQNPSLNWPLGHGYIRDCKYQLFGWPWITRFSWSSPD